MKGAPPRSRQRNMKRIKTERNFTKAESIRQFAIKLRGFGDRVAFRYFDKKRNMIHVTYAELAERIRRQAAGITAAGLAGRRIAIIGETSVEWVTSYISIIASGGVAIPLDRELDVEQLEGFLEFAEADAIFYSAAFNDKFAGLAKEHPTVTRLLPFAPVEGAEENDRILPYETLLTMGAADYEFPEVTDLDRMTEMLFTSGTTGSSKCVMLSERNIVSAVNAACETVDFSPEDRIVSVLPIHHTYELCIMISALNYGMNVAINDSLKRVLKNFAEFKPTGLVLVPLFVTTMNKKIWDEAKKGGKESLLRVMSKVSRGLRTVNIDLRRKLFAQVLSAFGGELNKIICGGAALNPELVKIFAEFGIDIYEGYGITECSPLIAVNPYFAPKSGSVGPAVPCCRARIDPDHKNDRGFDEGEIQAKGDNVMLGYYKNPEETAKVFTEDGWFCTGDIGYMDEDGYIYITGRKKYVIVLENGKNVFPEEIEEYVNDLPAVTESVVLGRKEEGSDNIILTAVVYPAPDQFENFDDHDKVEATVREQIDKMNRKLVSYKQIRAVEFRYEPFEKTTSKKIKRHLVK